jgi:uncharacterized membrane protein
LHWPYTAAARTRQKSGGERPAISRATWETYAMTEETPKTSSGMNQNVAGLLCYLAGWITGLIFFLIEKENKFVRFHAMQSIITFGALTVLFMAFSFIPIIGWALIPILMVVQLVLWILLMVKAYQGENFKLPVVGEIAEKNI